MALYKLNYKNNDLSNGVMEKANKESIDYEKDFENWLENSPHVLFEEEASTIMWIGRQVSATSFENVKYPDLMGIDSEGNVVIVELKKGRTPRDVVAQILEYASWADRLTYEELNNITMKYYDCKNEYQGMELREIHSQIFNPDGEQEINTEFNRSIRLYIVAEEISKSVKDVVKFLNNNGSLDINCMKYDVFKASDKEYYISTEIEEADYTKLIQKKSINSRGWNGDTPVKVIVKNAVDQVIKHKTNGIFTAVEVFEAVKIKYPDCNSNTIRCQLYSDCVNHTSRKHYKSGQLDLYYTPEKAKFRLYNSSQDGKWNSDGERID